VRARLRQQASGRHARNGVGFKDENVAARNIMSVPAVASTEKGPMGRHRQALGLGGQRRIDARRADFLGGSGHVFGRVIKKTRGSCQG